MVMAIDGHPVHTPLCLCVRERAKNTLSNEREKERERKREIERERERERRIEREKESEKKLQPSTRNQCPAPDLSTVILRIVRVVCFAGLALSHEISGFEVLNGPKQLASNHTVKP